MKKSAPMRPRRPATILPRPVERQGFTIVELLVAMMIVGVLLALLIPAVQSARESARRALCSNNLRQLGLALNGYTNDNGCFPGNGNALSHHARLLPYLGQAQLYNALNFENPIGAFESTWKSITLAVFTCPSDGNPAGYPGMTNYAWNASVGPRGSGPFAVGPRTGPVGFQQVVDGTVATAAASEWWLGVAPFERDPHRTVFQTPGTLLGPDGPRRFSDECHRMDPLTSAVNGFVKGGGLGHFWSRLHTLQSFIKNK